MIDGAACVTVVAGVTVAGVSGTAEDPGAVDGCSGSARMTGVRDSTRVWTGESTVIRAAGWLAPLAQVARSRTMCRPRQNSTS